MNKPYIYGHRGGMGYCIENTMPCFKKAIEMKVGIETDLQLTKDKVLVCFHDSAFKIGSEEYIIKNLTFDELSQIKFEDHRKIPTVDELFSTFKDEDESLRFSFDIIDRRAGLKLIQFAEKYTILNKIEITDLRPRTLSYLRKQNDKIRLIHTIPHQIVKFNEKTMDFQKLHELNIDTVNIKNNRATVSNFKEIIDNGFKCYAWGVDLKSRMNKILNLRYKENFIEGIYSDYPDLVKKFRDEIFA